MKLTRERTLKDKGWKNPEDLPKGPNGRPLCRHCQKETQPPKRTFCSDPCVHEFKIRSNPGYAREQILKRDRGICATCNLDTGQLREVLHALRMQSEEAYLRLSLHYRILYGFGFPLSEHYWEMDHIFPVAHGGGSCGLENLQTLCIPCHRAKTREQMRRKRLRRKGKNCGSHKFR